MKLSLNWLCDYIDLRDVKATEISERLTLNSCELESHETIYEYLNDVRVAQVVSVEAHPNADRLKVATFNLRPDEPELTIVCGAPNVKASMWVALAPLGTRLPQTSTPNAETNSSEPSFIEIRKAKIRGVESCGMLCSMAELGLTNLIKANFMFATSQTAQTFSN